MYLSILVCLARNDNRLSFKINSPTGTEFVLLLFFVSRYQRRMRLLLNINISTKVPKAVNPSIFTIEQLCSCTIGPIAFYHWSFGLDLRKLKLGRTAEGFYWSPHGSELYSTAQHSTALHITRMQWNSTHSTLNTLM